MNGQLVVVFQKYTSLAGGTTYKSDPIDMVRWKGIRFSVCLAGSAGTGTATAEAFESDDLYVWESLGAGQNLSATPIAIANSDTGRYVHLEITVPGGMTTATVWATAILRDM